MAAAPGSVGNRPCGVNASPPPPLHAAKQTEKTPTHIARDRDNAAESSAKPEKCGNMSQLMKRFPQFGLFLLLGVASACGDGKGAVDVNGTYKLQTIVAGNACMIDGLAVGNQGEIDITFTQDIKTNPDKVTVTVTNPVVAGLLALAQLPNTFLGTVTGNSINAIGSGNARTEGNCQFAPQIAVVADLDRDTLSGEITWSYQATGSDCAEKINCRTVQTFNGTRPPTVK